MRHLYLSLALAMLPVAALAADFDDTEAKIKAAMKSELRSEADTSRDRNRRPVQTLEFFGLRDDMTVIELIPGGGWYSKILQPVLQEKGQYIMAYRTDYAQKALEGFPGGDSIKVDGEDAKLYRKPGARFYSLENPEIDTRNADMVVTFRNYHNFAEDGRRAMNEAVFKALKPGGVYAVVDHTRRHMQRDDNENGRRIDPVLAIKEIQEAGFVFVDYSTLHYRLDDELRYEVGRRSVSGNTDRWTFKFIKPE